MYSTRAHQKLHALLQTMPLLSKHCVKGNGVFSETVSAACRFIPKMYIP